MTSTATRTIAPVDLTAERAFLGNALSDALLRVLESGQYILGPEVEALERAFAERCRCRHGVGVASGTDALTLGLLAVGVQPGDPVLTTPFSFFASAEAIAWIGATPVLADVEPSSGLLDIDAARSALDALDPRPTCILPVHLYGQLTDMKGFRALADERGMKLLEDGAQAHGAEREGIAPGELGDACTFSFYPTKNLGAAGEGGLVVTRDDEIGERLRRLRDHGSPGKYLHAFVATNSRLHAMQAAILNAKLPHLDAWNERRRELAARYDDAFSELESVRPLGTLDASVHAYHQYTVRVAGPAPEAADGSLRDHVLAGVRRRGVIAAVHYPIPVHLQEAAKPWGYGAGDFPVAEALAAEVMSLPVHPFLSDDDQGTVIDAVREFARG